MSFRVANCLDSINQCEECSTVSPVYILCQCWSRICRWPRNLCSVHFLTVGNQIICLRHPVMSSLLVTELWQLATPNKSDQARDTFKGLFPIAKQDLKATHLASILIQHKNSSASLCII